MAVRQRLFLGSMGTFIVTATATLIFCGCSDDSSPTNTSNNPNQVSIPLNGALTGLQLQANQTTQFVASFHLPPEIGRLSSANIDVAATMQHLSASNMVSVNNVPGLISLLSGEDAGTVSARVGGDEETVCQQGQLYGPYTMAEIGASPLVENVELSETSLQILNSGPAVICLELLPTFDATVSLDAIVLDVEQEECGEPVDFSGTWVGEYTCGNSCGASFGDNIELTIVQNGSSAYYIDDSGTRFEGTVCGNLFRFQHTEDDEIERGSMMIDGENHATKRSTWREQGEPYCEGNCIDQLTRVER